jgi:hypothetical protein
MKGRIREAQKHADPDPQHNTGICKIIGKRKEKIQVTRAGSGAGPLELIDLQASKENNFFLFRGS